MSWVFSITSRIHCIRLLFLYYLFQDNYNYVSKGDKESGKLPLCILSYEKTRHITGGESNVSLNPSLPWYIDSYCYCGQFEQFFSSLLTKLRGERRFEKCKPSLWKRRAFPIITSQLSPEKNVHVNASFYLEACKLFK